MAALHGSLSSVLPCRSHRFHSQNPCRSSQIHNLPSLRIVANIPQQKSNSKDSSFSDEKSFAVTTSELFLGLASLLVKRGNSNGSLDSAVPTSVLDGGDASAVETYPRREQERISSVEESTNPDAIREQRLKDVEAARKREAVTSTGFSFSAGGLLFPYHLGVAQFLLEKGYIKESTPLAGSSAGAIICAVIASGRSMQDALKATKVLAEDCRLKGTVFRLGAVLRDSLQTFLPDDIHIRSNGRVQVAVTQILWKPRGLLVDQFDSKEDLINAVLTSAFIPGYLAPRPATLFRNRLCIDGGFTFFMPPTSASNTVRVCAFPVERLGLKGIGISPDCNPENRATPIELFTWTLKPAEDENLDGLFQRGYIDAAVWAEQNPLEGTVHEDHLTESALA